MKHLNEYIKDKQTNEGLLELLKDFCGWLFGIEKLEYSYGKYTGINSSDINNKGGLNTGINLQVQNIKFEEIKDIKVFKKIIELSEPNRDTDTGLWYFDSIKNNKEYKELNVKPYNTQCLVITDSTFTDNSNKAKNIFGLCTYSIDCNWQDNKNSVMIMDYEFLPEINNNFDVFKQMLKFITDKYKDNSKINYIQIAINNNDVIEISEEDLKMYEDLGFTKVKGNLMIYYEKKITK